MVHGTMESASRNPNPFGPSCGQHQASIRRRVGRCALTWATWNKQTLGWDCPWNPAWLSQSTYPLNKPLLRPHEGPAMMIVAGLVGNRNPYFMACENNWVVFRLQQIPLNNPWQVHDGRWPRFFSAVLSGLIFQSASMFRSVPQKIMVTYVGGDVIWIADLPYP